MTERDQLEHLDHVLVEHDREIRGATVLYPDGIVGREWEVTVVYDDDLVTYLDDPTSMGRELTSFVPTWEIVYRESPEQAALRLITSLENGVDPDELVIDRIELDRQVVLVKSTGRRGKQIFHLPDPDDETLPRCTVKNQYREKWVKKFPNQLPHATFCTQCSGEAGQGSSSGPYLASKLLRMDADEVLAVGGMAND